MKTDWSELMFMQIRAGDTTLFVFGFAVVCVFLALAALRKLVLAAGGDPGSPAVHALFVGRRAVLVRASWPKWSSSTIR